MTTRERLHELVEARTRAVLYLPAALRAVFPPGAEIAVPMGKGRTATGVVVGLDPFGDLEVMVGGKRFPVRIPAALLANPNAGLALADVA